MVDLFFEVRKFGELTNIELYNFFTSNQSFEDYDEMYGTQPAPDPSKTSKKYKWKNQIENGEPRFSTTSPITEKPNRKNINQRGG